MFLNLLVLPADIWTLKPFKFCKKRETEQTFVVFDIPKVFIFSFQDSDLLAYSVHTQE